MATSSAQKITADYVSSVVGQIVFIGEVICGENWTSLSIRRGHSTEYKVAKFAQPKRTEHFTDELLC